jgi:hypothetical protein
MTQTAYVGQGETTFSVRCEACFAVEEGSFAERVRLAHVEGALRADADVAFRSCAHGHRLVVRRIRIAPAA